MPSKPRRLSKLGRAMNLNFSKHKRQVCEVCGHPCANQLCRECIARTFEPTAEEIEQAAAEIRQGWTESEMAHRLGLRRDDVADNPMPEVAMMRARNGVRY